MDASNTLVLRDPPGTGAPTLYSPDLAHTVLDRVAAGLSLYAISKLPGMPAWDTLYGWKRYPEFAEAYALARQSQADRVASEGLEAVDAPLDLALDGKVASAGVQRQTSRSNYRRWLAGCLDRETYGDRTDVRVSGELGLLQAFVDLTPRVPLPVDDVGELPHVSPPDVPPST